ncbi:MAG: PD40 domain-containing protein, partial [SAR324 cluster bacterium]|nr:PD40 domain-containing protein [SAR324 cluster bacterium]
VMGILMGRQNLLEVEVTGQAAIGVAHSITRGNSRDRQPVFSPDGRWVLFSSNRGGDLDLWKLSLETGAIQRITEDGAADWDPGFTADGNILWSSDRSGHFEIWTLDPSSVVRLSSTSALPQLAQLMLTDIPHFSHEYVAMTSPFHRAIGRREGMMPCVPRRRCPSSSSATTGSAPPRHPGSWRRPRTGSLKILSPWCWFPFGFIIRHVLFI